MANVKCENCDKEISSEASYCPKCGQPNNRKYCLSVSQQLICVTIAICILLLTIIMMDSYFDNNKGPDAHQQVAEEVVEQYNQVKHSGDHAKKCLHARIVAGAYLKVNDEAQYQHWKLISENECRQ